MKITTLELEQIDYNNKEHLTFLNKLMESTNMDYLWNLSDSNLSTNRIGKNYIVEKEKEKIGYLGVSDVIEAINGNTVNIYYAIDEEYRGNGYAKDLVKALSNHLFSTGFVDCIVAQVDVRNQSSQNVLLKTGFTKVFEDEEEMKFMQTRKAHI